MERLLIIVMMSCFELKTIQYNDVLSGNSVSYDYDLNNNIIGIRYPFINKYITYEYDNLDRLIRVKDWNQNILVEYYYLADGRVDYEKFGNGVQTNYYYDIAGRMDSIATKKSNGNILITVGASLDLNGNHIRESIFMPFVSGPGQGGALNANTNYQYSGNSNLLQNSTGYNFNTYQYNKNGATKDIQGSGGHILLNWDEKDRLTSFQNTDSAKTHLFEYDGLGNRRRFNDTRYALDILHGSNVLVETNLTGNPKSFYVHGLGLVCRIDPQTGAISYYHSDFRGSTLGITNASQDFTHQYQYEEFGQVERKFESVYNNPFQFVGKHGIMYDETGLLFMRARYYDASIGRFLSEDPVWGNNLFAYGENNPIINIDPSGRISIYNNLIDNINTNIDEGRNLEALLGIVSAMGYKAGEFALYEIGSGVAFRGAKTLINGTKSAVKEVAVHGNSLKSLKPTWGYKLFDNTGTFLKNGITSKADPIKRYTKNYMRDKKMVPVQQFTNRLKAWQCELKANHTLRGPLNKNMH
ncbi:MAG: RHS repeat-associated core domain-containing protein [Saprospiraceae bacterium]|uniref:RHS repeat-associated core domain-containing protein n=1 Tax=Candidatus Defluviibacterium haderslevense TaxID=2981993 RepID=A0A9D7XFR4_9BACT|nr:RHS repeat-associated core domain-containing protein [Candidatus Defluviibacterium haderslevense]